MISLETRRSWHAFDRIRAVHRFARTRLTTRCPIGCVHRETGIAIEQEVCVQTDYDIRVLQLVTSFHRLPERHLRSLERRVAIDWLPLVPLHLREALL